MQEHMQYAVGIDVGTSEVRCVIGQYKDQNELPSIVGVGRVDNQGYRKGVVVDVVETAQAIDGAIAAAERMSGRHIEGASVNINGMHISGLDSKGVVAVSGHHISGEDIVRAEEAATVVQLPPNREIIQVFARNYRLDGQDNIKDPLGMTGIRLEVDAHVITASGPIVNNLQQLFETAKTPINQIAVGSLAAAQSTLTRELRERGSLLLDIGASTTNMVVYKDGEVQHVAVLAIGGIDLTNVLAIGFECELNVAERIALEYNHLATDNKTKPKEFSIKIDKKTYTFKTKDIDYLVRGQLKELFSGVDKELAKIGYSGRLPGGVVICGGCANLKGIETVARQVLRLHARVLPHKDFAGLNDQVTGPTWCTALGLMMLDQQPPEHQISSELTDGNGFKSILNSVTNIFSKFRV